MVRRQAKLPRRYSLYEIYSGVILEDTDRRRMGQQGLTGSSTRQHPSPVNECV